MLCVYCYHISSIKEVKKSENARVDRLHIYDFTAKLGWTDSVFHRSYGNAHQILLENNKLIYYKKFKTFFVHPKWVCWFQWNWLNSEWGENVAFCLDVYQNERGNAREQSCLWS